MNPQEPWIDRIGRNGPIVFWTLFGVVTGATLAVWFGAIEMKPDLANLLGGVLGAGLGAAGGVLGGVVLYRRQRRDELRPYVITLAGRIDYLQLGLSTVEKEPRNPAHQEILAGMIVTFRKHAKADDGSRVNRRCHALFALLDDLLADLETRLADWDEGASTDRIVYGATCARQVTNQLLAELEPILGLDK